MRRCDELAVREQLHHVAEVDDIRAWNRRRVDPLARAIEHFESRRRWVQQRETFVVRVRTDAERILGTRIGRIVNES